MGSHKQALAKEAVQSKCREEAHAYSGCRAPSFADHLHQTDLEDEIQQPSPLKIIRAKKTPYALSTASTQYYRGRDSATSSLQAAFDDLLRSPTACKRPADLQKPLPSRPRSTSVPIIPELPAELPGSLLLENQGYPSKCIPLDSPPRGSPSPKMKEGARTASRFGHEGFLRRSNVAPESIAYMTSVPDLSAQHDIILYARSCSAFDSTSAAGPSPLDVLHESSRAGATTRPRSRPGLGMASSSIENLHTFSASGSNSNSDDTLKRLQSRVAAGNQDPSSKKRRSRRPDSVSVGFFPLFYVDYSSNYLPCITNWFHVSRICIFPTRMVFPMPKVGSRSHCICSAYIILPDFIVKSFEHGLLYGMARSHSFRKSITALASNR